MNFVEKHAEIDDGWQIIGCKTDGAEPGEQVVTEISIGEALPQARHLVVLYT